MATTGIVQTGFHDGQVPVLSTIGRGPKGPKGDPGNRSDSGGVYQTVNDMRSDGSLIPDQIAQTLGYFSAGDGLGSFYVISDDGSHDGVDTIALYNGLYAHRVPNACGDTSSRPTNPVDGTTYFDTDLKKPIWWYDGTWITATGEPAD